LSSQIQKLITIPAALQKVTNPVPRVPHPEWLNRRIRIKEDVFKQKKMTDLFSKKPLEELDANSVNPRAGGDLEDFGNVTMSKIRPALAAKNSQAQKRKEREAEAVSINPYDALPAVMPNISTDYKGWLKYQKQKWKIQKEARKRRRQLFGEKRQDATDAIGTIFRQQAELAYTADWQVLQLRGTETPGEVKAFVLIDQKVHQLKVIVPRQVFLNLKEDDMPDITVEHVEAEKVTNWTLPNGHHSKHLFKLTMSETTYVQEAEKLSMMFQHPSVEGVYETQVPLNLRAMLDLGCSCTFDETQRGVLGKGLEQGFDLSSLRTVPPKKPYMSQGLVFSSFFIAL
jgi:DNA polymerase epsilon subunit 1